MFLTKDDLASLTERKKAPQQIQWLIENNINFKIGAAGNPKVLVSHIEEVMGIKVRSSKRRKEPNEKALLEHMGII